MGDSLPQGIKLFGILINQKQIFHFNPGLHPVFGQLVFICSPILMVLHSMIVVGPPIVVVLEAVQELHILFLALFTGLYYTDNYVLL